MKSSRSGRSQRTTRRSRRKASNASIHLSVDREKELKKSSSLQGIHSHPLEGDLGQTLTQFFSYLLKKDADFNSCKGVLIPETVVYERSFPRGWIGYDFEHQELRMRTGKDMEPKTILNAFLKNTSHSSLDIVASYLSVLTNRKYKSVSSVGSITLLISRFISTIPNISAKATTGKERTTVEFFGKKDLEDFLLRRSKSEQGSGILQKFVAPKGSNNSLIQVVWSPHVCLVERRTNSLRLLDKKHSMYDRAVTFEGPSHFSAEVFVAPSLERKVGRACRSIVDHFRRINVHLQRMVLFFKTDTSSNLWFSYASSVRITGRRRRRGQSIPNPVNLSPSFVPTTPRQQSLLQPPQMFIAEKYAQNPQQEEEGEKFQQLETDEEFSCPNCEKCFDRKFKIPLGHVIRHFSTSNGPSPATPRAHLPKLDQTKQKVGNGSHPQEDDTCVATPKSTSRSIWQDEEDDKESVGNQAVEQSDLKADESAKENDTPEEIMEDALDALEDIIYESYSHFMHNNTPYTFKVPDVVRKAFGEGCNETLRKIGIWPSMDNPSTYEIQHGPVVARVQRNFDRLKEDMMKLIAQSPRPTRRNSSRASAAKAIATIEMQPKKQARPMTVHLMDLSARRRSIMRQSEKDNIIHDRLRGQPDDTVPTVLKRIIPGITNTSYQILRSEPLFLARDLEVCEECFLLFTKSKGGSRTNKLRRTQSEVFAIRQGSSPAMSPSRKGLPRLQISRRHSESPLQHVSFMERRYSNASRSPSFFLTQDIVAESPEFSLRRMSLGLNSL